MGKNKKCGHLWNRNLRGEKHCGKCDAAWIRRSWWERNILGLSEFKFVKDWWAKRRN